MSTSPHPLAFGLLIDRMGAGILIVSSALSLAALLALGLITAAGRILSPIFPSIAARFAHNRTMADEPDPAPPRSLRERVKWALTPPQSYVVYVIGLLLVYSVSYYAGTLNPKKGLTSPQSVSAPRD